MEKMFNVYRWQAEIQ